MLALTTFWPVTSIARWAAARPVTAVLRLEKALIAASQRPVDDHRAGAGEEVAAALGVVADGRRLRRGRRSPASAASTARRPAAIRARFVSASAPSSRVSASRASRCSSSTPVHGGCAAAASSSRLRPDEPHAGGDAASAAVPARCSSTTRELASERLDLRGGDGEEAGAAGGEQQLLALEPVHEALEQVTLAPQDGREVGQAHAGSLSASDART